MLNYIIPKAEMYEKTLFPFITPGIRIAASFGTKIKRRTLSEKRKYDIWEAYRGKR